MNGADLLGLALENERVKRIFGVPGEENLGIVEALRRSTIKLVVTRHVQAAAFMAATHGRLTGEPGVCLSTLGPGALNLTTGAAYALLGAMPMVMITGQKGVLSRKQALFQVVDIVSTMTPLTKMAHQIVGPATIPSTVREGFRVAQQERPGPVHLELPEDIAAEKAPKMAPVPRHPITLPGGRSRGAGPRGRNDPRGRAAGRHAGRGREPSAPGEGVVGFRQVRADAVLQHADGQGLRRRRIRSLQGTAALSERDYVHDAIERADLIISIGHDTVEKPPFLMGPGGPKVLHVGYLPATVEEVYFPHAELIGVVGPSLALLADRLAT
jgi:acetolactate synthase-1/2/3 large subunit